MITEILHVKEVFSIKKSMDRFKFTVGFDMLNRFQTKSYQCFGALCAIYTYIFHNIFKIKKRVRFLN